MKRFETLQSITSFVLSSASKASKIAALVEDGFSPIDAENIYQQVMRTAPTRVRRTPTETRYAFTMGIEIECYNVNISRAFESLRSENINYVDARRNYNHNDSETNYKFMGDGSINGNDGVEVVTPILKNLNSLEKVCNAINGAGAKVNKSCGLHVHFGAETFTTKQWYRIVANYGRIEDIIDSFLAPSRRGNTNCYCESVENAGAWAEANEGRFADLQRAVGDRYHKVNLCAFDRHHTIEFRHHHGTTDFKKIKAWVKFLESFLTYTLNNEALIVATTIDELPFLNAEQKRYFNARANALR